MPQSLAKVYLIIDDKEYQRKFVESIINLKTKIITLLILVFIRSVSFAQFTERTRLAGWDNLIFGNRFMDRFLPMPVLGELTSDTWGAK